jgi:hypothetical protein
MEYTIKINFEWFTTCIAIHIKLPAHISNLNKIIIRMQAAAMRAFNNILRFIAHFFDPPMVTQFDPLPFRPPISFCIPDQTPLGGSPPFLVCGRISRMFHAP